MRLYEPDVHIIVGRKAGTKVEFGNTLLLGESGLGFVLEWEFIRQSAPADSALLPRSVDRMEEVYAAVHKGIGADQALDSHTNRVRFADD